MILLLFLSSSLTSPSSFQIYFFHHFKIIS
nr:MAG TPA: hypothetical protein [Caudoviricetes sp.]